MATESGVNASNYTTKANGQMITGVTSPYTVTKLINGQQYYFSVASVTAVGESVASVEGKINTNISCATIHARSAGLPSGVYSIYPSISVYCDMDADGGGWTLVAKLLQKSLPITAVNTDQLLTNVQPNSGEESKLADATINALGYSKIRVIPSGAPTYIPFFFQPGNRIWDFSAGGAGNLNGVPVCNDAALTINCITRINVIDGGYAGYRNYNGTENYAFTLNHPNNLGFTGRLPYAEDYNISATVWVR